jgi:hypothetical protein
LLAGLKFECCGVLCNLKFITFYVFIIYIYFFRFSYSFLHLLVFLFCFGHLLKILRRRINKTSLSKSPTFICHLNFSPEKPLFPSTFFFSNLLDSSFIFIILLTQSIVQAKSPTAIFLSRLFSSLWGEVRTENRSCRSNRPSIPHSTI